MADSKPKEKITPTLRTPKPKNKLGLTVPPPLRLPHEELIRPVPSISPEPSLPSQTSHTSHTQESENSTQPSLPSQTSHTSHTQESENSTQPSLPSHTSHTSHTQESENSTQPSLPSQTSHTSHTQESENSTQSSLPSQTSHTSHTQESKNSTQSSLPSQTSHTKKLASKKPTLPSQTRYTSELKTTEIPIAPVRDFSRVANSISRDAVPGGYFKGKSKQLYDYLYSVTRGAIVPTRSIRISRPKLMTASGIGSKVTFDVNIAHLCEVGLITVRSIAGEHIGNEYTVFLPEELPTSQTSQTSETSETGYTQKLDRLVSLETRQTRYSLNPEESDISTTSNTFLNTCIDDDDTHMWRAFSIPVLEAAKEITAGSLSYSEDEQNRWRECGKLLAEELKNAAKNTSGPVSSAPAFFNAHLKRRFARPGKSVERAPQPQGRADIEKKKESVSTEAESRVQNQSADTSGKNRSRFSLEECKAYAEHLRKSGQGIINPGGYATSIWRTGEADALIDNFLNRRREQPGLDEKICPDCRGRGSIEAEEGQEPTICNHPRLETAAKLFDHIKQLRQIHFSDPGYEESHLAEDLRYRALREGIEWNDSLAEFLINLKIEKGIE